MADDRRHQYSISEIKRWLSVFVYRFFQISQFKRSCIPNAPKVGSGGSLSPRGDYRAPSDSEATVWLQQITRIPDRDPAAPDDSRLAPASLVLPSHVSSPRVGEDLGKGS
jgi:NAD+ synthase (glutamine-hydrolysing)